METRSKSSRSTILDECVLAIIASRNFSLNQAHRNNRIRYAPSPFRLTLINFYECYDKIHSNWLFHFS